MIKINENFSASEDAEYSLISVENHFREVTKMVEIGYGAPRPTQDYMLTSYGSNRHDDK